MPKLLTVNEAADRLRLSPWTVRQLAREGRIRSVRIVPGRISFTEDAITEAIRRASRPEPEPVPA